MPQTEYMDNALHFATWAEHTAYFEAHPELGLLDVFFATVEEEQVKRAEEAKIHAMGLLTFEEGMQQMDLIMRQAEAREREEARRCRKCGGSGLYSFTPTRYGTHCLACGGTGKRPA